MDLKEEIRNTILAFDEPFTTAELVQILRQKNLITDENKYIAVKIVNELLELSIIKPITFSNKYYMVSSENTW